MRSIIHEQPYEEPLAAGQLRYEQDGQPTGAVEQWRLTAAVDGYQFLRVDLDARDAASGHSYLYHAVLNANGRLERLKYRFWGQVKGEKLQVSGDIVFDDASLTATRTVNGRDYEQELDLPPGYVFWFPSSVGLGLLVRQPAGDDKTAVGLETVSERPSTFSLFATPLQLNRTDERVTIRWDDQKRTLWLDEQDWPVKMRRNDGLTAVAARHIYYQK